MTKQLLYINLFLLLSTLSYAQNRSFEKIYLQLDNTVYTQGSTIWFKAIVTKGTDHSLTSESGVLNVELIGEDETITDKKLVKLTNGIGQGGFKLAENCPEGIYQIRAYTQWNQNFGADYFFEQYIHIFRANEERTRAPINSITLTQSDTDGNYVEALLYPFDIDPRHEKKPTVFIDLDGKKDTLAANRDKKKAYKIGYPINPDSKLITFKMQTSTGEQYSKTIALDTTSIDLQFFPESGNLVHGFDSKVGFKAIGTDGKGRFVEGTIVDNNNNYIASFKSNALGMGTFILTDADASKQYFAKIESLTSKNESFPLPKVLERGTVLSITKQGNFVNLSVLSNHFINESLTLKAISKGLPLFQDHITLKNGKGLFNLNFKNLPEGVITFSLLNANSKPIAERLYFNHNPEKRLTLDISTDKKQYSKRELTKIKVSPKDFANEIVDASVSLTVINKELLGDIHSNHQNMLSYFLLDSELKGSIENPGFYFQKDSIRYSDIDALLLTQGWRKHLFKKTKTTLRAETQLTVSGFARKNFSGRDKEVELLLKTLGKYPKLYAKKITGSSPFLFKIDDEYNSKKISIRLESQKEYTVGKKLNYQYIINKKTTPLITFNPKETIVKVDSIALSFVENKKEELTNEGVVFGDVKYKLNNVTVSDELLDPNQKRVHDEYGKPTSVIDGDNMVENKQKWSSSIYDILNFTYPDEMFIQNFGDSVNIDLFNGMPTLMIIDGQTVFRNDYRQIVNIPAEEIKRIEIIKNAANFLSLYLQVNPGSIPNSENSRGNVLALYTHTGKGLFPALNNSNNSTRTSIEVFSPVTEFYTPKYKNLESQDWDIQDLRSLLHWQPQIDTKSSGFKTTSFYNADLPGDMLIIVEAISKDGKIGYEVLKYEVIDQNVESQ